MAEARNYPNREAGSSLDDDIERFREEFEVEICRSDGDPESDLHWRLAECKKNPGHVDFTPEPEFTIEHLPVEWRDPLVYKVIRFFARHVVHVSVKYTSTERSDGDFFSGIRGLSLIRYGTGLALFPDDLQNKPPQQCPFKNCKVSHPHNVTPEFPVFTASHVVFDSSEAEQTELRFFFDSEIDTKGKGEITAQGIRILNSTGTTGDYCTFACVSHILNIRDLCRLDTKYSDLELILSAFDTKVKKPELQYSPTGTKEKIPEHQLSSSNKEEKKEPLKNLNKTEKKKPDSPLSSSNKEEKRPEQPLGPPHTEEKTPEPPLRDTNSKKKEPLVVIVSHPHGCSKHVSTGYWTGVKSVNGTWDMKVETIDFISEILTAVSKMLFFDVPPDIRMRRFFQDNNISFRDFLLNICQDMAIIFTSPITVNEITHEMLLAMWEKTTSNSTLSGQVSEEELTEIALSVVNDITSLKSSEVKRMICMHLLSLWKKLTSDSTFITQLCREEFSEICKHVVNDIIGTNSLTVKDTFEMYCSLFPFPFKLPGDILWMEDEANPFKNMTEGQVIEKIVDDILNVPSFIFYNHRMLYSTKTCPGSSGAPVFLFYDKDNGEVRFKVSCHSGARKGNNMSCGASSICSLYEKVKPTDKLKQEASQDDIKPTDKLKQEASQDDIKPTDKLKQEASQDDIKPTDEVKQEASQDDIKPTDKLKQEVSQDDIKPTDKLKQEASQDDIKPTDKLKQEASQDDIKPTDKLKQEASQDDIKPTDEVKQEVSQDDIKPTDKLKQEASQDDIKPTDKLKQEVSQDDIKPTDKLKQEASQDDIKPTDKLKQEVSQDDIKPTDELKQEVSQDDIPLD